MKLRQILDVANPFTFHIDYGWKVDNRGTISPVCPVEELTMDTDIEVVYYWYHHLNPDFDKKAVTAAIEEHDFNAFRRWCSVVGKDRSLYFPDTATIFVDDTPIGSLDVLFDARHFALISGSDYECG